MPGRQTKKKKEPVACSIEGCSNHAAYRLGYCRKHYRRWRIHGSPHVQLVRHFVGTEEERFWHYTYKTDGCWVWNGCRTDFGHGIIATANGNIGAHIYSYRLHRGDFQSGLDVCHHCDNPWCVNPEHLFLGTQADNNHDRHKKGRTVSQHGTENPAAKLNDDKVREIRRLRAAGTPVVEIARMFGVTSYPVWGIVTGRYWKHVV